MPQPWLAGLLGISQAHVCRLACGAKESEQTSRLLDILERDIAAGVDVTRNGYRIGFPVDAEKAGDDFRCGMPAASVPPPASAGADGDPEADTLRLSLTLGDDPAALFGRLSALAERCPEFGKGVLGLVEAGEEMFEIDIDAGPAAGADEVTVRLKPCEALLRLLAATGAGKREDLLSTETGHCEPPRRIGTQQAMADVASQGAGAEAGAP